MPGSFVVEMRLFGGDRELRLKILGIQEREVSRFSVLVPSFPPKRTTGNNATQSTQSTTHQRTKRSMDPGQIDTDVNIGLESTLSQGF